MRNEQGFVVVELLMQGLIVAGFVLVTSMVGLHSAVAISTVSASKDQAHFAALRWDLENLDARQAIHYADERSYSSSSTELGFTPTEGVTVSIVASPWGWAATATHVGLGSGEACAMHFGATAAPESPVVPSQPGELVCTG